MRRIPAALTFETIVPGARLSDRHSKIDGIMSWSTFEHVQRDQLLLILQDLHACLRPGGCFSCRLSLCFTRLMARICAAMMRCPGTIC